MTPSEFWLRRGHSRYVARVHALHMQRVAMGARAAVCRSFKLVTAIDSDPAAQCTQCAIQGKPEAASLTRYSNRSKYTHLMDLATVL